MHWLDGATISADGTSMIAWRLITPNQPFIDRGRFLPAALIELMAQAAAAGAIVKAQAAGKRLRTGLLAAATLVQVLGDAHVGQTITVRGREECHFAGFVKGHLEASVADRLIARADLTFHLLFE